MSIPHQTQALLVALLFLGAATSPCTAQLKEDNSPTAAGERYGDPIVGRFEVGAEITGRGGETKRLLAMVAVPLECEEQQVKIVEENFSPNVARVTYRNVKGGLARQMVISVPRLAVGEKATARVTFEVATRPTLPLEDDEAAKLTLPRRLPREVRRYATASPYIESRHGSIRSLSADILKPLSEDAELTATELTAAEPEATDYQSAAANTDWQKIERLYDYVLDNIKYAEGPDTSALATLREGTADCHGRSALFVALCRAAGYPARIVWVNDHCYAEFYLEDAEGNGSWRPIESAGSRAFGEMPLARVILQKGDSFSIPERKREKLRYATDFVIAASGKPKVKFIREQL